MSSPAFAVDSADVSPTTLEAMLACSPAFIIALDEHGAIEFINRTLPHISKADVIGSHWRTFFPADQVPLMEARLREMYATRTAVVFETNTVAPDGRAIWFETQLAPIPRPNGMTGAILVSQDITERKRTQAELLANRHLALLGTLAAGVAHEINTPIQYVSDSIQFLRGAAADLLGLVEKLQKLRQLAAEGGSLDEAIAAAAEAEDEADLAYIREHLPSAFDCCLDGIGQVSRIARSLKDFAHPDKEATESVDVNRVIENALTIAANQCKYVAQIEKQLTPMPPIWGHGAELGQVILNLLVNAAHAIEDVVKGTDQRGLIAVTSRYVDDAAIITISDTGTGIPESIRGRIFDPFFTTKEAGRGTGQGLSIAWSMIKERHGGEITFDTEVGKGTTFTIRIPASKRAATSRVPIVRD